MERRSSDERIAVLETQFDGVIRELKSIRENQQADSSKLDTLNLLMAEARGAARLGRWVSHVATAVMAGVGGAFSGNMAAAQKVQSALENMPHIHP